MMNRRHRPGFTLIELTVTIVIILILATISLSIGSRVLRKGETDETFSAMKIGAAALHEFSQSRGRPLSYGTTQGDWPYLLAGMSDESTWNWDIIIPSDMVTADGVDSLLAAREKTLHENVEDIGRQVWQRLQGHEASRRTLSKIDEDLLLSEAQGGQNIPCLHDSWGNPILIVLPGRKWRTDGASELYNDKEDLSSGSWRDSDGTVRTFEERLQGPAINGRIYLVSAGPDGLFGNLDYAVSASESFPPESDEQFVNRPEYQRTLDNIYSYEVRTW
jgi:prepilin-type N-terminal cleavage/methylation domain-containing protein